MYSSQACYLPANVQWMFRIEDFLWLIEDRCWQDSKKLRCTKLRRRNHPASLMGPLAQPRLRYSDLCTIHVLSEGAGTAVPVVGRPSLRTERLLTQSKTSSAASLPTTQVVMISGCKDDQTSADIQQPGNMTQLLAHRPHAFVT